MNSKKLFLLILLLIFSVGSAKNPPYVILISFDGFRWDYLNRNITPNIDKMISEGVRALSLKPAFPTKTFPNHISIITGMYTEHHGIIANVFTNPETGKEYRLGDTVSTRESEWYKGEAFWETAQKHGIKTASYFWPGTEITDSSRKPTYRKFYDHFKPYRERIDTVIQWLSLPAGKRPYFISVYFHDTDTYGHDFGPNSPEINNSIMRLDSLVGYLHELLNKINLSDSINVIITSDHGMTEVSPDRVINIESLLTEYNVLIEDHGPVMRITPQKNDIASVYNLLKSTHDHYSVYLKENMPEYYHYSESSLIPPVIVIADLGWSLINDGISENLKSWKYKGDHGYDNNTTDMQGVFIAEGPAFKNNYETGTLLNIDIYPLLCKIYNLPQADNIDGRLERIEYILNEK